MTYEEAKKKYIEYKEVDNNRQANKYYKLMHEIQEQDDNKKYYETRITDLMEFINKKGLYNQLQIFLNEKDNERFGE